MYLCFSLERMPRVVLCSSTAKYELFIFFLPQLMHAVTNYMVMQAVFSFLGFFVFLFWFFWGVVVVCFIFIFNICVIGNHPRSLVWRVIHWYSTKKNEVKADFFHMLFMYNSILLVCVPSLVEDCGPLIKVKSSYVYFILSLLHCCLFFWLTEWVVGVRVSYR